MSKAVKAAIVTAIIVGVAVVIGPGIVPAGFAFGSIAGTAAFVAFSATMAFVTFFFLSDPLCLDFDLPI